MARADNAYSRLVGWLKILLPLAALILLSNLFLLSRTIDPARAIPFAKVDVNALIREPRVTQPDYSGMTEDGTALHFTATAAIPDPADAGRATAKGLQGEIETPDGAVATVASDRGEIDTDQGIVTLEGAVVLTSTLGYRVETAEIVAKLDQTRLESAGAIAATGPFGRISAGQMLLTRDAQKPGSYVLVFNQGVKLIYEPKE